MTESDDIDHLFKLVLIGDSEVGKSNVLLRFTKNTFSQDSKTTIGVEFSARRIDVDGKKVKIQLWDTAGQEKFRAITKAYYKGAVGAMIIYDITKRRSFENMMKWLQEIREWADSPNIVVMLLGNKVDMEDMREVPKEEAIQFAEQNRMGFLETSAKTGQNIEFAFKQIVEEILRDIQIDGKEDNIFASELSESNYKSGGHNQNIRLDNQVKEQKKKKSDGCC